MQFYLAIRLAQDSASRSIHRLVATPRLSMYRSSSSIASAVVCGGCFVP
jgi:hypothetical protein